MPEKTVVEELKTLASAYSQLNTQTNRLWSVCAVLLLAVIATDFNEQNAATVVGITVERSQFFVATFLVSVLLSVAYCSSHVINYRTAKMFLCFVVEKKLREEAFAESKDRSFAFSYEDFAHSLYNSNYNRVYPVEDALRNLLAPRAQSIGNLKRVFAGYKLIVDISYSSVPTFAALLSMWRGFNSGAFGYWIILVFSVFVAFSLLPWLALMSVILDWSSLRFGSAKE